MPLKHSCHIKMVGWPLFDFVGFSVVAHLQSADGQMWYNMVVVFSEADSTYLA